MILAPVAGIIVDKFRVKKILFFTVMLLMGVVSFFLIFVPKVPLENAVEIKCDSEITFVVHTDNVQQNTNNASIFNDETTDEFMTCKVRLRNIRSKNL